MRVPALKVLYCCCETSDRSGQSCRCDVGCTICKDDQATHLLRDEPVCTTCGHAEIARMANEAQLTGEMRA